MVGGGGVPSDYVVSTQLQLWLFCCWGWAVTILQVLAPVPLNVTTNSPLPTILSQLIQFTPKESLKVVPSDLSSFGMGYEFIIPLKESC